MNFPTMNTKLSSDFFYPPLPDRDKFPIIVVFLFERLSLGSDSLVMEPELKFSLTVETRIWKESELRNYCQIDDHIQVS